MILSDELRRRQNEVKEEGIQEGMKQRQRQLLLNFLSSSMSMEQVAAGAKVSMEYVQKLAEEMKMISKRQEHFPIARASNDCAWQ